MNPVKVFELVRIFWRARKKIQASELFTIFVAFCQNFQKANEEVIASERAKVSRTLKATSVVNHATFSLFF
jgi:tellurite resistance protein